MATESNLIAALLPADNVIVDADLGSKKRVFEQVGLLVENQHRVARSIVFDSLFARERLGSTGLGQGVAIPHGRIKGLREAIGVFVRTRGAIPFDAPDGLPVSLVFVLLVPDRATDLHLEILGQLAQLFSDKVIRERLTIASSAAEVHKLFVDWSPNAAGQRSAAV